MDGQTDGRTDGRTDERTDGQTDERTHKLHTKRITPLPYTGGNFLYPIFLPLSFVRITI